MCHVRILHTAVLLTDPSPGSRAGIVLVDQRGSGESLPPAELKDNTTWDLVEDMEKVRKHLEIEKWHVFGGSWSVPSLSGTTRWLVEVYAYVPRDDALKRPSFRGSTLSLGYAQTHPDRVKSLTLRGIFTVSRTSPG